MMDYADIVRPEEMDDARRRMADMTSDDAAARTAAGFSFTYDGRPSNTFLRDWAVTKAPAVEQDGRRLHRITRLDPATGLAVICDITEYTRFPVVEWVLRLRNTSSAPTPLLEGIRSLDIVETLGSFPYLNYWTGDYCAADGYEPFRVSLAHEETFRFAPMGGRPTNRAWPYFNLDCPDTGRGLIVVVGWGGQWEATFHGGRGGAVRAQAGQERARFRLLPGEEVRTPLSVLLFWRGDRVRAQNVWRRWMLAHNLPRAGGRLPEPMLPAYTGRWFAELALATEETQKAFIDRYVEEGIRLDYWWMDAGWYPCSGNWPNTGTWEPDAKRFPRGLRPVCDHAHAKGMKTLLWFEPERVAPGTWLHDERPQWLLSVKPESIRADLPERDRGKLKRYKLLDLGNAEARQWLTDHFTEVIRREGIDFYRQDFNIEPIQFWWDHDAPDREGITEIRYVEGYLAFWTELRRRFPDMLIDSCASGGRRNDLETMRLSVPLHKTDYKYVDLPVKQAFHHSLSSWLPYYGAYDISVEGVEEAYSFRSSLAPMTMLTEDLRRREVDWGPLRRMTEEWRRVTATGYFYGDYYPLTPYSRDETQWIAWQFHRPDTHGGVVQVFRRARCPDASLRLRFMGLDAAATYAVTDMDSPDAPRTISGEELMRKGFEVASTRAPQAWVILYAAQ